MRHAWLGFGILCVVCAALQLGGESFLLALRYEREAILDGEVWRCLTGHLVHAGWTHLGVNLFVAAVILAVLGRYLRPLAAPLLICLAGVSGGLLAFAPGIAWYVGLSGVLHGLLGCGALRAGLRKRQRIWLAVVLLLAAKVAWEQIRGPHGGLEDLIGARVVVAAHLAGLLSGLVAWVLLYSKSD
ncbi:MAG: rhombosortase [Planctomycetota bacterium]